MELGECDRDTASQLIDKHGDIRAVTDNTENVTGVGKLGENGVIVINHGQIVALTCQLCTDCGADSAAANDYNFHIYDHSFPIACFCDDFGVPK
jgi:hypothetical protein